MAITLEQLAKRYRVSNGGKFRLRDYDPADTWKLRSKDRAEKLLEDGVERLKVMQQKLYAQDTWALLLIFQAMDAAGKDGTIKHVLSGVNPQGCDVHSFKAPSSEELSHTFLWRCQCRLPERGRIGIFNRSYYEEVLVVRVHPELLLRQRLPRPAMGKSLWKDRFNDIACFERHLDRNGVIVRKFFLNVSRKEQKERFLARLDEPKKNWKFSGADIHERRYWSQYMQAYQDLIRHTAADHAPWYVVPADHKWFSRLIVAAVIVDTLEGLKLEYPHLDVARRKALGEARSELIRA